MDSHEKTVSDDDFDTLEQEVLYIMKLAQETCKELEKQPSCDYNKLSSLSEGYLSLVRNVQEKVKRYSKILKDSNDNSSNQIYSVQKLNEISLVLSQLS